MRILYKVLIALEIVCLLAAGILGLGILNYHQSTMPSVCENCTYNATAAVNNTTTATAAAVATATPKPKPVIKIIYFHQNNCEYCVQQQPVITQLAKDYNVIDVNLSESPATGVQYSISSTPTTLIFVNGVEHRIVNVHSYSDMMAVING